MRQPPFQFISLYIRLFVGHVQGVLPVGVLLVVAGFVVLARIVVLIRIVVVAGFVVLDRFVVRLFKRVINVAFGRVVKRQGGAGIGTALVDADTLGATEWTYSVTPAGRATCALRTDSGKLYLDVYPNGTMIIFK